MARPHNLLSDHNERNKIRASDVWKLRIHKKSEDEDKNESKRLRVKIPEDKVIS